jgi:hypothetical protein
MPTKPTCIVREAHHLYMLFWVISHSLWDSQQWYNYFFWISKYYSRRMSARRTKNNRGQSQRANKQEGAIYMWNTRRNRENLPPLNNDTIFDFGLIRLWETKPTPLQPTLWCWILQWRPPYVPQLRWLRGTTNQVDKSLHWQ